jgi:hypothetical protein
MIGWARSHTSHINCKKGENDLEAKKGENDLEDSDLKDFHTSDLQ